MNKLYILGALFIAILLGITWQMAGGDLGGKDTMGSLALLGAAAIAIISIVVVIKYIRQMQNDTATGELEDGSWDGIGEYKNELPFGWAIIFAGLTIWAVWYFIKGYPLNAYSQIGEYNKEVKIHDAEFNKKFANMDESTKIEMGNSIFIVQCAPCHGLNADGMDGTAANLNHRIAANEVEYVVEHGSNNHLLGTEMPMPDRTGLFNANTGAPISDAEIKKVAQYVANGLPKSDTKGHSIFEGTCAPCHGADGKGQPFVAPDIKSFTPKLVANVLTHGKKGPIGTMPAFANLTEVQKEALGSYITSLSN